MVPLRGMDVGVVGVVGVPGWKVVFKKKENKNKNKFVRAGDVVTGAAEGRLESLRVDADR